MIDHDLAALKVLVVEDNQHFRLLIRTVLASLGIHQVVEAQDGQHALQLLKDFPADFVIVDWKMEPMDGISFAHKVRLAADSPNPALPIIMISGYSEDALAVEARDAGVNLFLPKPISARTLVSGISQILKAHKPFVRSSSYYGPDRRRGDNEFEGEERRSEDGDIIPSH